MILERIKFLQKNLKTPILIKKKENLLYLTGHVFDYRAQEYLLVTKNKAVAFGSGLERIEWLKKTDQLKNIGRYHKGKLDIEWGFSFGEAKYLKYKAPKLKINPGQSPVDVMRQAKDAQELSHVRKSMQVVEKVFEQVKRQLVKKQWTEQKLAQFIQESGFKLGAEDISFPAIVASGPNAAIPHHVPSPKKLKEGEAIIIDFGFKYKQYCSDFTRTVFLKKLSKKLEMAYNQVEKAYRESMSCARAGVKAGDVYQKSVDVLAEKHLEKYFIHSLGHGTGLEIHELPNLSPKSRDILANGMVFSIEPGVYFPKVGGIRIEDLVYLEKGKAHKFINISTKLKDNVF